MTAHAREAPLTWLEVPALMRELRNLALGLLRREGDTVLHPTELVLSALRRQRLSGQDWSQVQWSNRAHFFGAMRRAMMRAFLDHVRKEARRRRNLGCKVDLDAISLDRAASRPEVHEAEMAGLYHALELLEERAPEEHVRIAHHRLFEGLSIEEIAALMEQSPSTVLRTWRFVRSFLHRQLVTFLETP